MKNTPRQRPQKNLSPQAKRNAISICINSVILMTIYYGSMGLESSLISYFIMGAYMLIFAGFLISYIIYNRGFSRREITTDMLPDSMSHEEKLEFIEDGKNRLKKSKWMISVIFPFLIIFMAEAMYLFLWKGLLENIFT